MGDGGKWGNIGQRYNPSAIRWMSAAWWLPLTKAKAYYILESCWG